MNRRALIVLVLLGWQVLAARHYVRVWHSDRTLWAHAAALAPLKQRPALNLEKANVVEVRP